MSKGVLWLKTGLGVEYRQSTAAAAAPQLQRAAWPGVCRPEAKRVPGERGRGFWRLPQLGKCCAPGLLGCLVPSCRPSRRRAPDCEVPGSVEETKEAGRRRGGGRTGAGRRAPRIRSSSPLPRTESPASSLGITQVLSSFHKLFQVSIEDALWFIIAPGEGRERKNSLLNSAPKRPVLPRVSSKRTELQRVSRPSLDWKESLP